MATESELVILGVILEHDGEWNWYKVGRRCMNLVNPDQLSLKSLIDGNLVEERLVDDEPLPRLFVTELGKSILETAGQET